MILKIAAGIVLLIVVVVVAFIWQTRRWLW